MITGFKSSHRVQSLLAICLISAGVCGAQSVQAGPTLETTENSAIGAQATFNNSWAQTFEAKGSMSINGGTLLPFQQVATPTAELPNSGLAELVATVSNLSSDGGTLEASASINPGQLLNGTNAPLNNTPNNIVLNTSGGNGLPALAITPSTADSSVIGASIIGTNIGTDTLQVTGSLGSSVVNTLTAF
jgi:hypothetical protein